MHCHQLHACKSMLHMPRRIRLEEKRTLMGKLIDINCYLSKCQSDHESSIQQEIDFLISELDYCLKVLRKTHSNDNRLDALRWMQSFVSHCEQKIIRYMSQ